MPTPASIPVLAIITLSRALKERFSAHRVIARWTLPIWLYVSVTGVGASLGCREHSFSADGQGVIQQSELL